MKTSILALSFSILLISMGISCDYMYTDTALAPSPEMTEKIDQIVNALDENGQFSGAVLVSIKGEIVYKKAVGFANIKDSTYNTVETKFRIASFTKPFTSMLILQLVEDGKLALDGKLTHYLPEFPEDKGGNITIHQLLTHTAGITGESRITNLIDIEKEFYTREDLFNCIVQQETVFAPGEGKEYSNFGFALLGLIIERVTGKSYDAVLNEKICRPAGMKNTLSDVTAEPIENRAFGYVYDYFTGPGEASFLDMSFVFGYGQLISTVEDLYLFDQALYSDKLLTEKSKELFFNKYGWFPHKYPYGNGYKRILSHSLDGSVNGFQSHTQRIGQDTVFIVALRNVKECVYENQIVIKWPTALVKRVLAVIYDEDYDLPRKSAAFTVFRALVDSGEDAAVELAEELQNQKMKKYYFDEEEFGYFEDVLNDKGLNDLAIAYHDIGAWCFR